MGTPHFGSDPAEFMESVAKIATVFAKTNNRLLKHLRRDSEFLQDQMSQFTLISHRFSTVYAYEEYETEIAGREVKASVACNARLEQALTAPGRSLHICCGRWACRH